MKLFHEPVQEGQLTEDWTFAYLKPGETLWGPHGYHRYPAKFIPQLVHRIIESYSAPSVALRWGRAIASNFWSWLYKLRHNKPTFKALLCKCALQGD